MPPLSPPESESSEESPRSWLSRLGAHWSRPPVGAKREYAEVSLVLGAVSVAGVFAPVDYRIFGDFYLLAVVFLSLRVGPGPILYAAVLSSVAWCFFVVPPKMTFSPLSLKDSLSVSIYFAVALITGQFVARIRHQQRTEREREQRATALFHLAQAVSTANTLDEGLGAALRQADTLFGARTAILLPDPDSKLSVHPASTLSPDSALSKLAHQAWECDEAVLSAEATPRSGASLHLPLESGGKKLGLFSIAWSQAPNLPPQRRELMEAFATQIALLVERENLRAASEREKILEESDRLHRTLLDSVSHELKTPLAVLRAASEGLAQKDPPRREALVREIRTAAQRLDQLVANLLDQTRLQAGGLQANLDWCDVRDLLAAAKRAVGEGLAGHPLQCDIPSDMPIFMADAVLMEHALANLLLNAAHHTPPGTPIHVRTGFEEETKRVFIAVADEGPGISPELKARLFQKFQRGSLARPGGLGLGLSIVYGFMRAQSGEVHVDDTPGGGARFTLYLPHKVHETVPNE